MGIVLKIGFFIAAEFRLARMNDAIEGERASLIFRDEKSIRARRRFNCVKTNADRSSRSAKTRMFLRM